MMAGRDFLLTGELSDKKTANLSAVHITILF